MTDDQLGSLETMSQRHKNKLSHIHIIQNNVPTQKTKIEWTTNHKTHKQQTTNTEQLSIKPKQSCSTKTEHNMMDNHRDLHKTTNTKQTGHASHIDTHHTSNEWMQNTEDMHHDVKKKDLTYTSLARTTKAHSTHTGISICLNTPHVTNVANHKSGDPELVKAHGL